MSRVISHVNENQPLHPYSKDHNGNLIKASGRIWKKFSHRGRMGNIDQ